MDVIFAQIPGHSVEGAHHDRSSVIQPTAAEAVGEIFVISGPRACILRVPAIPLNGDGS